MRANFLIFSIVMGNMFYFTNTIAEELSCELPIKVENPSPYLAVGTKIRGLTDKKEWGALSLRLQTSDGWKLDNGRKALDQSYGLKWEVSPAVTEKKLFDADGKEVFGDYDKLWFKIVPPKTDKEAYRVYKQFGTSKSLSTDGYVNGNLHYLSSDGMPDVTDPNTLKYLTQTKPLTKEEKQERCQSLLKIAKSNVAKRCKDTAETFRCSLNDECFKKTDGADDPYAQSEAEIGFYICLSKYKITKDLENLGCEEWKDEANFLP